MPTCPTVIVVAAEVPQGADDVSCTEGVGDLLGKLCLSKLPWLLSTTPSFFGALRLLVGGDGELVCSMGDRLAQGSFGACIAEAVLARPHSEGWLVLPANMPDIQPETLRLLAEGLSSFSLVFPQYKGLRGYPVGFGPEFFSELIALQVHERGTQRLLARYPGHAVDVDDPAVLRHGWGGVSVPTGQVVKRLNTYQSQ